MNKNELCAAILAILFVSGDAIELSTFAQLFDMEDDELDVMVQEIIEEKKNRDEGLLLTRLGDKLQLCTNSKYADYIKTLFAPDEHTALSNSVLETLSIIAYKQPVTRAEVDEVRGVRCNYAVSILVDKGLVHVIGRKDVLGRPSLFATTDEFLRHFGIASLEELPKIDFEVLKEEDGMEQIMED